MHKGSETDLIRDFEVAKDRIDLSDFGIEYSDISALTSQIGNHVVIDLSSITGADNADKLILKDVATEDLTEANFIL